jgi:hypothetical protein
MNVHRTVGFVAVLLMLSASLIFGCPVGAVGPIGPSGGPVLDVLDGRTPEIVRESKVVNVNIFETAVGHVENFFKSGKAKAALEQAVALIPKAAPIVADIAAITPNRTVAQVAAAYAKYAVPVAQELPATATPTQIENALLNLGTQVLAKNLPAGTATVATNVLNTAVQLAVTGMAS